MSLFLTRFASQAAAAGEAIAFCNSAGQTMRYDELDQASEHIARCLAATDDGCQPVVVHGHKSPLMLASFLACMKCGRAYVPVDTIYPPGRVADILAQLGPVPVISTLDAHDAEVRQAAASSPLLIDSARLHEIVSQAVSVADDTDMQAVDGQDALYILFTSGSTGKPKGVQMSAGAIDDFMGYMQRVMDAGGPGQVFFNRVPYTFDVSVFDMVVALSTGSTLYALEHEAEQGLAATFEALGTSGLGVWVSTPSFVEACLADPHFGPDLLPDMHTMVLCGEALRNSVASSILDRFEGLRLVNTYGPTETQAVTDIVVDRRLVAEADPMPVGLPNPSVHATVRDPQTLELLPYGQEGEVFLDGATLATCYRNAPELTERAFLMLDDGTGRKVRCYRTGDKGRIDASGRLYCLGRLDFQVKVNGFRVELPEIEERMCSLDEVSQACVLPIERQGHVAYLKAFVTLAHADLAATFETTRLIKAGLAACLPSYMVPRTIAYLDEFPLNANGKIDRKALASLEACT